MRINNLKSIVNVRKKDAFEQMRKQARYWKAAPMQNLNWGIDQLKDMVIELTLENATLLEHQYYGPAKPCPEMDILKLQRETIKLILLKLRFQGDP